MSWAIQTHTGEPPALRKNMPAGEIVRVLASGPTATVVQLRPPKGPDTLFKRYFFPEWRQRFQSAGRHTYWGAPKVVVEAENLMRLGGAGVPTLPPLAWGVDRSFGFVRDSWLLLPFVPEAPDLQQSILSGHSFAPGFWTQLGQSVRLMHQARCRYRGLCARNLLVQSDRFCWIDPAKAKWSRRIGRKSASASDLLVFLSPLWGRIAPAADEAFAKGYGDFDVSNPDILWKRLTPWDLKWTQGAVARERARWD
jgi:tRNA A-37 threonylcarbamoyl transferase component Bud32